MFRINLKIALRNLLKHKTASLINISGLAIGPVVFIVTGLSSILIALLTVSWQAWRAAKTNPVDALKYE